MTVAFIDTHRDRFAVAAMCRVLEFAERTFYAAKARPPSARALADADHKLVIEVEWKANYSCYGASIAQASATPVGRFRNRPDCAG